VEYPFEHDKSTKLSLKIFSEWEFENINGEDFFQIKKERAGKKIKDVTSVVRLSCPSAKSEFWRILGIGYQLGFERLRPRGKLPQMKNANSFQNTCLHIRERCVRLSDQWVIRLLASHGPSSKGLKFLP
jgi:hypothetical protein